MKSIHRYNSVLKFFAISLFLIVTMISFTACENFLQGEEVLNEINNAIEYNNSKAFSINVEVIDDSCGKIKTPATGEITKKVTDTFSVRFEPSADHKFVKWEAVIKDLGLGEKPSDYIEFENEESLETRVTFKKASDKTIVIRPVCPARLSYTFYQGGGEVYSRDSAIEFSFNEDLGVDKLTEFVEDYVSILNLPEGISSATYFKDPVIRGKKILFRADTSNGYIPVANNAQRIITVRIPKESVWYINEQYSQPVKVYLDTDIKETYLIGSETSAKTKIKYVLTQKDDASIGVLKINGEENDGKEHAYSVGQSVSLRYRIPDGYTFRKWKFTDSSGKEIAEKDLSLSITDEEISNNLAQLTITVDNYMPEVITVIPEITDPVKIKYVKPVEEKGTFKIGTTTMTQEEQIIDYGVGSTVSLSYKLPEGYTFIGWLYERTYEVSEGVCKSEFLSKDDLEDKYGIVVSFDETEDGYDKSIRTAQALITVKDFTDNLITIRPVSYENLGITKFNLDDVEKVYNRDSDIVLTFNNNILPTCKNKIVIKIPGLPKTKTVEDYFEAPVITEKTLTIKAKNDTVESLLPLGADGTNTISVSLPVSDFYYEVQTPDGKKQNISLDSEKTYSYKISSQTSKKTKIKFIPDDETNPQGSFKVNGGTPDTKTVEYSMGETLNLSYTFSKEKVEDYFFKNWKVTRIYKDENDDERIDSIRLDKIQDLLKMEFNESTSISANDIPVYSVAIKVIDSVEGLITVQPEIGFVEDVEVLINGEHGKFSPPKGSQKCKLGKSYHIEFEPDSDYGFVRWQLVNSTNGNEIENYSEFLTSFNLNSDKADFTMIGKPSDDDDIVLELRPVVCERPQIISKSPYSTIVNRDTSIQIMFDYEMSINSIYYSQREMDDLITDSSFKEFLDPVIIDNEERYYGYERKDGSYVYKNISITNNRTGENLIQYFEPPVFENKNRILTLNVKRVGVDNNVDIPKYSQILITIDKGVFYEIDNKPVSMYKSEKWMYQVNSKIDGAGPAFDTLPVIKLAKSASTKLTLLENVPGIEGDSITWEHLPYYDANNFELAFDVRDGEGESGLASSFSLECQQVYNSNYVPVTNGKKTLVNIDYDFVNEKGTTQFAGNCSQLREQLESGIYKVKVIVRDKCGNETQYPPVHNANDSEPEKFFYILIDKTGPDITKDELTFENIQEEGKLKPVWIYDRSPDYKNAKIYCTYYNPDTGKYTSIPEYPKTVNKGADATFTGLKNGAKYCFDVYYYDWKGNSTNRYYYYEYTIPAKPKAVTVSTAYGTSATISATKPDEGYCSNTKVYYKTTDSDSWELGGTTSGADGSVTINNLSKGKIYEFDVRSYDSASGKESLSYKDTTNKYPTFTTVPAAPTLTKVDYNNAQNSLKVDYRVPTTGDYDGIKIVYSKLSNFTNPSTISLSKAQLNGTYTITGLTAGTKYYVKAVSWYKDENNKTDSIPKSAYTMPDKVPANDLYLDDASWDYIDLCWDSAPETGEYSEFELYYKLSTESDYKKIATVDEYTCSYYIGENEDGTKLIPGKGYDFKVVTVIKDTDNNISVSNTAYAPTYRHYMTPKAPVNVKAEKLSNTSFKVTWTKPSDGEFTGYNIRYGTSNSFYSSSNMIVNITNKDTTSYTVSGVSTQYYYIWVETYLAVTSGSTYSSPDNYNYSSTRCSLALDAVSGLTISPHSTMPTTGFTLSWTNPSNSANYDGIEIWRKLNSAGDSSYTKLASLSKTTTSYSSTGLSVNTKYDYKVVTYKGSSSTASNAVKAENVITKTTMSSAVGNFKATVQSPNKVSLSWTNPDSANYNEIKIYRGTTLVKTLSKGTTSYDVTGLSGGTSYTFYVKTTNSEGVVSNSYASGLTRRTHVAPVTNLNYSATTQTSKTLTWTNPSGNYTGVKIYVKTYGSSDSSYTLKTTITNGSTSYTVTGLSAGNAYVFKVESYYSTDSTNTATLTQYTAPPAATNFKFVSRTYGNTLKFSWTNPSSSNYEYVNLRYRKVSVGGSFYTSTQTKGNTSGSLTLDSGWRWEVYAETYYHGFTTASTSLYNVTQPSNPYNIKISSEHTQVKVSWSAPTGEQNYYRVKYRRKGTSVWSESEWLNGSSTSWTTQTLKDGQLYEFTVYSNLDFSNESSGGYDELNSSNKDATSGVQYYAPPAKIVRMEIGDGGNYYQFTITEGGNTLEEWVNSIDGVKFYKDAIEYNVTLETTSKPNERSFRISKSIAPKGSFVTIIPYHNRNTNHSEWNGMNSSYTSLTLGQPFQIGSLKTQNIYDPDAP